MDFDCLDKKFHTKLYALIDKCMTQGIILDFETGFISLEEQASQWKQSRSDSEIDAQIAKFHEEGLPFLMKVFMEAKGQLGPWVTDDLPGFTWHNWGQAYTFWITGEDGKPVPENSKLYTKVAELAKDTGLAPGYNFKPKMPRLVQLSLHKSPANTFSPREINDEMERLYGKHK